jgi:Na+-transporting NADH:ubiquinone oxidoreductase subunit NqrC
MKRLLIIVLLVVAAVAVAGCAQDSAAAQQKAQCFANEKIIQTAMGLFKADSGLDAPLKDVLDSTHVACPSGGTYSYDPATGIATCSIHGHP